MSTLKKAAMAEYRKFKRHLSAGTWGVMDFMIRGLELEAV
jgi:hypothetical protein